MHFLRMVSTVVSSPARSSTPSSASPGPCPCSKILYPDPPRLGGTALGLSTVFRPQKFSKRAVCPFDPPIIEMWNENRKVREYLYRKKTQIATQDSLPKVASDQKAVN